MDTQHKRPAECPHAPQPASSVEKGARTLSRFQASFLGTCSTYGGSGTTGYATPSLLTEARVRVLGVASTHPTEGRVVTWQT